MKMGGIDKHTSLGFTIIEVMIVLAVTAALFVTATTYISGRQAKTEFQVGSQQIQQQLQQVISDVQNGYFPGSSNLSCTLQAGKLVLSAGVSAQGTNQNCIFVGKVLLFGGNSANQYKVFSLAGKRLNLGVDVANVSQAAPVAIAPTPTGVSVNSPDLTDVKTLPNGLTFVGSQSDDNSGYNSGSTIYTATAILSDFSPMSSAATMQSGGAQNFSLHGFRGSGWFLAQGSNTTTPQQAVLINAEVNAPQPPQPYPALAKMRYCFASGGTNQSVLVTMTSGLQVSSEIKSGATCGLL